MSNFNVDNVSIELSPQKVRFSRGDLADNIIKAQKAAILYEPADEETQLVIGYIKYGVIDLSLLYAEGESLAEVCDSANSSYHALERELFRANGEFKAKVPQALGDEADAWGGLLYVEGLFLEPEYRGHQLGLAALYALIRYGSLGCQNIFLHAQPFWNDQVAALAPKQYAKICKKLRDHYASIGFTRIGSSDCLGLNLLYKLPEFPRQPAKA